MKLPVRSTLKYLAPAAVFLIILVIGTLSLQQTSAKSGPPPSNVPDFADAVSTNTLDEPNIRKSKNVIVADPPEGWETVFEEDFEDENWESQWTNLHQGGDGYKYGTRAVPNSLEPFSTKVAWASGTNPDGQPVLDPFVDGYPDNASAWLIAGPFDFTEVANVNLYWEYNFEADPGDTFEVHASTDFINFSGPQKDGGEGGWVPADWNLSEYAGKPFVWLAFIFKSDDAANAESKAGLFIDNIRIDVRGATTNHLPMISHDVTPTPEVTPTPTVTPGDSYYKGFTNNIDPWGKVRWSNGAISELDHSDSCEGDICGFLNLKVEEVNHYTIVSPELPVKPAPYHIETEGKIRSTRNDMDSWGIIFGASTNGESCPNENFDSCFNHYYELRTRYRDKDDDQWVEFKLVKVTGHDDNNQPIETDLSDWKESTEDPDYFIEWDIIVEENGDITIKADDDEVAKVNDTSYINNPYYGLIVTSADVESSEVKFDFFEVK